MGLEPMGRTTFFVEIGSPPLPREHGAWMMLYIPLLAGLIGFGAAPGPALLLVLAVSGAFLAQNAAGLLVRGRARPGTGFWLVLYAVVCAAGSAGLLLGYGMVDLLPAGLLAGMFLSRQALKVWRSRKKVDHSIFGELAAVGALTLTGPAAAVVSTGSLNAAGLVTWAACAVYFGGSVFFVKALVGAATAKSVPERRDRWRILRGNLLYHACLAAALVFLPGLLGRVAGAFAIAAFLPAVVRAFLAWRRVPGETVSLKQVGLCEMGYALWFAGWLAACLRVM